MDRCEHKKRGGGEEQRECENQSVHSWIGAWVGVPRLGSCEFASFFVRVQPNQSTQDGSEEKDNTQGRGVRHVDTRKS